MRSKEQERQWNKIDDRSTPVIRQLLDQLEKARPDLAPMKLTSDPRDWKVRMVITKPLRSPGYGYFGCFICNEEWVRGEIANHEKQLKEEHEQATLESIGAGI